MRSLSVSKKRKLVSAPGYRGSRTGGGGPPYGPELVDQANSATIWVAVGTNTVADDGGEVKTTYGNNATGSTVILGLASTALTEALKVGHTYLLTGLTRVSAGATCSLALSDFGYIDQTITLTTNIPFSKVFTASATSHILITGDMSAGESIWVSGISVKEVL